MFCFTFIIYVWGGGGTPAVMCLVYGGRMSACQGQFSSVPVCVLTDYTQAWCQVLYPLNHLSGPKSLKLRKNKSAYSNENGIGTSTLGKQQCAKELSWG